VASEKSGGSVADALKIFVATLVLLVVLASSMEDQTKYAWAQHELELFRDLRLSSWQAYVDDFVSTHYWSPLNDGQDVAADVLRPGRDIETLGPVDQDEVAQKERSIAQISAILQKHGVEPRREPLRAGAIFGWTGDAPHLTGALRDYRLGSAGYLWLFKPAVDDLAAWIDRALKPGGTRKGTLASLRCAPPTQEQIDLTKTFEIAWSQHNDTSDDMRPPEYIADYSDATLGRLESPAISSRCTLVVDYLGKAELSTFSEDIKGHLTALFGPDPSDWLKLTATDDFKSIPETTPDFRLHRLQEGYADPFIGRHQDFLPYAHAVWPEISALSIDDAITYLNIKRTQKREDVEIFGFKVPFEILVTSSPILVALLCINLRVGLARATPEQLDVDLPGLGHESRFKRIRYPLSLALTAGLPSYVLLYVTYILLTQRTETDSFGTLFAALREAVAELDLPEAWSSIREQAEGVVGAALWSLLLAAATLTIVILVGRHNAIRLHALWNGDITQPVTNRPPRPPQRLWHASRLAKSKRVPGPRRP
jgi:hypothetical protein